MPKKFAGENSKAVVAKARKAAIREAEVAKKQKEIEDEYWRDDDKHLQRKQQRKVCDISFNFLPLYAQKYYFILIYCLLALLWTGRKGTKKAGTVREKG